MGQASSAILEKFFSKPKAPTGLSFEDMCKGLGDGTYKRVIILAGAGMSTAAGIPDFRSPDHGIYSKIKDQVPYPEAVFDYEFFKKNPVPFFTLLKAIVHVRDSILPTRAHHFLRLLHDKGILLRCYTQNVDGLEHRVGLPRETVIEAHGTLNSAHCIICKKKYEGQYVFDQLAEHPVPHCPCGGIVKPDVVLFREAAFPAAFFTSQKRDFTKSDLVIIIGTSLSVQPFASLYHRAPDHIPRLVINKTYTFPSPDYLTRNPLSIIWRMIFGFHRMSTNYPSVMYLGDCDEAITEICRGAGWLDDLRTMMAQQPYTPLPTIHLPDLSPLVRHRGQPPSGPPPSPIKLHAATTQPADSPSFADTESASFEASESPSFGATPASSASASASGSTSASFAASPFAPPPPPPHRASGLGAEAIDPDPHGGPPPAPPPCEDSAPSSILGVLAAPALERRDASTETDDLGCAEGSECLGIGCGDLSVPPEALLRSLLPHG